MLFEAIQVHSVFNRYSEGSNLKIGLAIGQTDFAVEQKSLILGSERLSCKNFQKDNLAFSNCNDEEVLRYTFQPYNVRHALAAFNDGNENGNSSGSFTNATKVNNDQLYRGGQSAVDILVCSKSLFLSTNFLCYYPALPYDPNKLNIRLLL